MEGKSSLDFPLEWPAVLQIFGVAQKMHSNYPEYGAPFVPKIKVYNLFRVLTVDSFEVYNQFTGLTNYWIGVWIEECYDLTKVKIHNVRAYRDRLSNLP